MKTNYKTNRIYLQHGKSEYLEIGKIETHNKDKFRNSLKTSKGDSSLDDKGYIFLVTEVLRFRLKLGAIKNISLVKSIQDDKFFSLLFVSDLCSDKVVRKIELLNLRSDKLTICNSYDKALKFFFTDKLADADNYFKISAMEY